ncbi:MAG: aspartate aminotransferase family protein [Gammaproteobacteria bacterium]|nr:MAG: aspartate aminotransferase family protein [Gammaproteobacteria bacterium]
MSKVLHRICQSNLPTIAGGEGVYLHDTNGKKYIDACGGAAVSCLGHNHPVIKQAMMEQLNKISYAHTSFFTNEPQEKLAQNLLENSKGDFGSVYFVSGGSEAIETSLKLARQYFYEQEKFDKKYFIARKQSYHGNTLGALSIGGNLWRRTMFDPILQPGQHISACYAYRDKKENESEYEYGQRVATELEDKIIELGAKNVAAFVAETVVGATVGVLPAVDGYFKTIRAICDKYDVLLILDEIMCGMGRCGTLHACEQEGIQADLQTIAKGLAGGYQALGAVLVGDKIHQQICQGSGMFHHGHTYIGHPMATAAGLAVQQEIQEKNLLENVNKQGELLKNTLQDIATNHPFIGDVRGRGLFVGLELVKDKNNKQPFGYKRRLHATIKKQAMDNGLMIYPMGGTIDGKNGNHILLAPPFIATSSDIEQICNKLIKSIDSAIEK